MTVPTYRAIEQQTGRPSAFFTALAELDKTVAEVERLRAENKELYGRLDELAAERDEWRTKASWI